MTTQPRPGRIWTTVYDARPGRDARLVDADNVGEKLMTFTAPAPYLVGDVLWLPDGSQVKVTGRTFHIHGTTPAEVEWIVHVGDLDADVDPEEPETPPGR